jgi:hypothetical protein
VFPAAFSVDDAAPVALLTVLPTAWPALRTVLPRPESTWETPFASVPVTVVTVLDTPEPALATVLAAALVAP